MAYVKTAGLSTRNSAYAGIFRDTCYAQGYATRDLSFASFLLIIGDLTEL
jgi:hypothetical protein